MTSVYEAWNEVMRDVQAIRKDSRNAQQGFNFRGIDAVMNAVGPALRDHGVTIIPNSVEAKHRDFTTAKGTVMHEAIVTVGYSVIGPDGQGFTGQSVGEAADAGDKATSKAMSVAYRTFLLQALTIPTDEPDPDETITDRGTPDPYAEQGWDSAEQREAKFAELAARAKALPDDNPAKDSMRSWLKSNGINPKTLTSDQANSWLASLEEAEEVGATEPDGDGWKNAAERTRTMKSLMERIAGLPAFESELVNAEMARIGITGEKGEHVTKAQATELLAAIAEAEELAKEAKP